MKRQDYIFAIMWFLSLGASVVFKKGIEQFLSIKAWGPWHFFVAFCGVFMLYLLFRLRGCFRPIKITYERMEAALASYKTLSGANFFNFPKHDEDRFRQGIEALRWWHKLLPWRRPLLFHTCGLRAEIFWIDMVYFKLLADFARIGFDVRVVLHDTELSLKRDPTSTRHFNKEFDVFNDYVGSIRRILGYPPRMRFYCGRDVIKRRFLKRGNFVDLVYGRLVPYVVSLFDAIQNKELDNEIAHNDLMNFIDSFSLLYMPRRSVVVGLYWARQASRWNRPPLSTIKEDISMALLVSDFRVSGKQKESFAVYDRVKRFNILDNDSTMLGKIFSEQDDDVLGQIGQLLCQNPRESYIWSEWLNSLNGSDKQKRISAMTYQMLADLPHEISSNLSICEDAQMGYRSLSSNGTTALRPEEVASLYLRLGIFRCLKELRDAKA